MISFSDWHQNHKPTDHAAHMTRVDSLIPSKQTTVSITARANASSQLRTQVGCWQASAKAGTTKCTTQLIMKMTMITWTDATQSQMAMILTSSASCLFVCPAQVGWQSQAVKLSQNLGSWQRTSPLIDLTLPPCLFRHWNGRPASVRSVTPSLALVCQAFYGFAHFLHLLDHHIQLWLQFVK